MPLMADDDRTALLDGIEADLAGVERALARLDAGSYFVCEVCGASLDDAALAAAPMTARCPGCTGASAPGPVAAADPATAEVDGPASAAGADADPA